MDRHHDAVAMEAKEKGAEQRLLLHQKRRKTKNTASEEYIFASRSRKRYYFMHCTCHLCHIARKFKAMVARGNEANNKKNEKTFW
jgi:hypothetical protein